MVTATEAIKQSRVYCLQALPCLKCETFRRSLNLAPKAALVRKHVPNAGCCWTRPSARCRTQNQSGTPDAIAMRRVQTCLGHASQTVLRPTVSTRAPLLPSATVGKRTARMCGPPSPNITSDLSTMLQAQLIKGFGPLGFPESELRVWEILGHVVRCTVPPLRLYPAPPQSTRHPDPHTVVSP